ncbi:MAG: PspC domain-containing protein [Chloroflexota bacterium]
MKNKKLTRTNSGMLFGVADGVANYINLDVTIVRILFVILALVTDGGFGLLYLILAILMPKEEDVVITEKEPEVVIQ